MYTPPFTISAEAINKIAEISGLIERYAIRLEQRMPCICERQTEYAQYTVRLP